MTRLILVPTLILGLLTTATADPKPAAAPTAEAIMQAVEDRPVGKDMTATHSLVILPKNGAKRLRSYTLLRKEYGESSKLVTFFLAPTDVRGAAFMVYDNKKSDDQRWIYLPAIGQVRRLVVGDSRQSFFGSDFVFEDLTNRDPDQDTHKLVGSQKVDSWDCWVIESTPKNARGLDFVKYRTWVWKQENMTVRQELYDSAGKVTRRVQTVAITKIQDFYTFKQVTATNLVTGSESRLEVSDVHYNTGIDDERFSEAQLSRGAPSKK
jgi:outer membrane lipoprotein-sorting protein